jgi:hypothetical protein
MGRTAPVMLRVRCTFALGTECDGSNGARSVTCQMYVRACRPFMVWRQWRNGSREWKTGSASVALELWNHDGAKFDSGCPIETRHKKRRFMSIIKA